MEIINLLLGDDDLGALGRFLLAVLMVVFLLAAPGYPRAQEQTEGLPFFVDTATFKALDDPDKSYVEIYILLSSKSLHFEYEEDEQVAGLQFEALIEDTAGSEKWSRRWRKDIVLSSDENLQKGQSIFEVIGLFLEPDFYTIHISLTDEHGKKVSSVSGELYVPAFPQDELSISQLEMALDISASQETGSFVKNGVRVLPNPMRTYNLKAPVLYYYAEIYDLSDGSGVDSTYSTQQEIVSTSGELVKSYQPVTKKKPGRTAVEVGGINVVGLEPDTYFLRIKVHDHHSGAEVFNQRWFQVSSSGAETFSSGEEQMSFTEEEAQHREDLIRYVASDKELKIYRGLNLEGKAHFLEEFWQGRDPDLTTPVNEFRREHLRRWNYSNEHFSRFQNNDGWKTDQGRVYIIYGPPDDIERYPSDIRSVAWERWQYYSLEGGIEFIFADLSGFDNYVLIHSTAKSEYRDPNWPDKITHAPLGP